MMPKKKLGSGKWIYSEVAEEVRNGLRMWKTMETDMVIVPYDFEQWIDEAGYSAFATIDTLLSDKVRLWEIQILDA